MKKMTVAAWVVWALVVLALLAGLAWNELKFHWPMPSGLTERGVAMVMICGGRTSAF